MADSPQDQEPTADEIRQMQKVSAAGGQAAAEGNDPAAAMREERDRIGFAKLDDETINALAEKLNELNIAEFAKRGAFDPPPEPVGPPSPPTAPPAPGETAPTSVEDGPPAPPQKRTFAHRFMGIH